MMARFGILIFDAAWVARKYDTQTGDFPYCQEISSDKNGICTGDGESSCFA